jgi:hypothetical protein
MILKNISNMQFPQAGEGDQAYMYLFLLSIHKLTMQAYKKEITLVN